MVDSQTTETHGAPWKRILFMLLFAVIYSIAEIIVLFVALFQLAYVLITKHRHQRVLDLGESLSTYIRDILRFVTFNSEVLPFPFSPWPRPGARE